ncbi:transposase [Aerococcus urinaeequi]|uniref:transposase n=1 Tax=Aerococcus urinaeequi TaxID=51665 RepID=UPI003D6A9375
MLDYLLDKNPLLKDTYNLIHNLRESLQENDSEAFKAQLAQSKLVKLPSGLRRVLRTFIKLQRYIGNTFKCKHLTNGRIEGLNNGKEYKKPGNLMIIWQTLLISPI